MRYLFLTIGLLLVVSFAACAAPIEEATNDNESAVENEVATATEAATEPPSAEPTATAMAEPEPTATAVPEPTATEGPFVSDLPILGVAPDITNETWLNSEPMTLSDNLGKVVLVEFWTYT